MTVTCDDCKRPFEMSDESFTYSPGYRERCDACCRERPNIMWYPELGVIRYFSAKMTPHIERMMGIDPNEEQ